MTHTNTTPYQTKKRLFFMALSTLFIFFGMYVYFVSASVVQVIARKEVEREIVKVNSHIGDLESDYINAKKAITADTLARHGFVVASADKVYVQKAATNLVLVGHDEN